MLKYYLVQAPESAILGIASLGYVIAIALTFPYLADSSHQSWTFLPILLPFVLLPFRRRLRALRTQYDIDEYHAAKAERGQLSARFRRNKRWLRTAALHIPSAFAAFVAIFLPIATHATHPGSHFGRNWSVSLPLTVAVFPGYGEYALCFFSRTGLGPNGMNFFVFQPPQFSEIWIQQRKASRPSGTSPGSGNVHPVIARSVCDERPRYGRWWIECETASDHNGNTMNVVFHGRAEDRQKFYEILKGIRPAHLD